MRRLLHRLARPAARAGQPRLAHRAGRASLASLAGLAGLALLGACGSAGPGSTPEDTVAAAREASADKDYAAFAALIAPEQLEEMAGMLRMLGTGPAGAEMRAELELTAEELQAMSSQELFAHAASHAADGESGPGLENDKFDHLDGAEILDTQVEGERAMVRVKSGDTTDALTLVRVDGKWYIDMQ